MNDEMENTEVGEEGWKLLYIFWKASEENRKDFRNAIIR